MSTETIRISGSSDDLIHVHYQNRKRIDEFNVVSDEDVVATLNVGGVIRVKCLYDGCWTFALSMTDEGEHLDEEWKVWYENGRDINDYTLILALQVPEKTRVFLESAK